MQTYEWYTELVKPSWAPPSWIFGPVWTLLYAIIAVSFGTVFYYWLRKKIKGAVTLPFALNILFNALFTPIQFGLQNNVLASIDIVLVLATLVWALVALWQTYPKLRWVSLVNIPYVLWVAFATVLQLTITVLNLTQYKSAEMVEYRKTYINEAHGYSIELPSTWKWSDSVGVINHFDEVVFFGPASEAFESKNTSYTTDIAPLRIFVSSGRAVEDVIADWNTSGQPFPEQTVFKGENAYIQFPESTSGTETIQEIFVQRGAASYGIVYAYTNDAQRQEIEHIVDSLEFTNNSN